ncbi:MAG: hypothetical protein HZA18_04320 [Nitrospirae bacterium]|nr:hypothetical protein [Nitrospirota bacterium]
MPENKSVPFSLVVRNYSHQMPEEMRMSVVRDAEGRESPESVGVGLLAWAA